MGFTVALSNVLLTLFYILPGYLLCKMKKAKSAHLPTLSAILVYIGTPFLELSAFMSLDFSLSDLKNMGIFFVLTLFLQILFLFILYTIFRKRYHDSRYRLFTIGSAMGNVGFFGLPVVRALFPENPEVACYSAVFMVSMNILVFTMGIFCLTGDPRYMSLKAAFLNPNMLGLLLALPVYLFGLGRYMPAVLIRGIDTVAAMTTPLCMFILGIRLASMPLRQVFGRPLVYGIALMKLLVFPLFCYGAVYFLPVDPILKASLLVLSATPCAAVILSQAELHESGAELAADSVLVSTLFCFLSIPLLTLLL